MAKIQKIEISCIIPIFNGAQFLSRCIDSILNQSFRNFELILVDDGSVDDSWNICEKYASRDDRIRIFHRNNHGVSSARNFGLEKAIGKYVCFVDCDDWVDENYLLLLHKAIDEPDADCARCNHIEIFSNHSEEKDYPPETDCVTNINRLLVDELPGMVWNRLFKREFLLGSGITFDENIGYGEDAIFVARMYMATDRIVSLEEKLYHYNRCNEFSAIGIMDIKKEQLFAVSNRALEQLLLVHNLYDSLKYLNDRRASRVCKAVVNLPLKDFGKIFSLYENLHGFYFRAPKWGNFKIFCYNRKWARFLLYLYKLLLKIVRR